MNVLTIADALAARYLTANLTGPVGYPAIRHSTARLPNAIPADPWVLVMPPSGEAGGLQDFQHYNLDFIVLFHVSRKSGDLARDIALFHSWLGILLAATRSLNKLGVTGVMKSYPTTWEFVVVTYAGYEFDAWQINVRVEFEEVQTLTP